MKVINFAVAAAAMLVFPVLFCSCNSGAAKQKTKPEVQVPKTAAAEDPKPIEITSEASFAAEAPSQAEPVAVPVKAEPAKVEAKTEPVAVPVKAEPAKVEAKTEPVAVPAKVEAKTEPVAVPAKVEAKTEPVAVPVKAEPAKAEPVAVPVKAEPAKVAAKTEPVAVPAKAEPSKAAAKAKPVKAAAKAEPVKTAAKAKPAKAELPCEHTVRTGDNLWKISRQYYGSGNNWKKIYEANKSQIKRPEFLEPGTVLKIPAK